jgi:hypothetical protein
MKIFLVLDRKLKHLFNGIGIAFSMLKSVSAQNTPEGGKMK